MANNHDQVPTQKDDHELRKSSDGSQSSIFGFRHRYQPGPQNCEDPEQYCTGGYHPVTIGDTFQGGRFTVIHKLGFGGGATVWLCQDSEEDRYVALKIMQARDSSEDSHELKMHRYLQEKLDDFDRGSMIALYEHFWIDGPNGLHLCLVFEVAGPALTSFRHWDQWRKIRPDYVRHIGLQIAERLLALHQADVVFGDLSGGNVIFRLADISRWTANDVYETFGYPESWENRYTADNQPVNEPGAPTYLYEGITFRNCDLDLIEPELAFIDLAESYVIGTERLPHVSAYTAIYSAPEVLLWKEKQDRASDIWALACILFELRTGEELFEGDYGDLNVQAAMINHLGAFPKPWVAELRRLEGTDQPAIEGDASSAYPLEEKANAEALMENVAISENDHDASEIEPLVVTSTKTKHNIIRCILLSIIDSIRSTGRYFIDFFDPDNLNPWVKQLDVEMALDTDVTEEVIEEHQIPETLVPLEEAALVEEVVPAEAIPEGLMQRIYDIGTFSDWHSITLDERLERAWKFYQGMGWHDQAADTEALMAEVDTGNSPVGQLSDEESAYFASLLFSMLKWHKADRARLEDVVQHPWFTTPTNDPWELLGGEAPWIATYHPGHNYNLTEDVIMAEE